MLERLDRGEGNTNTGTETATDTDTDTDADSGTSGARLAPGGGADRGLALLTVSLAFAVVVLVVMIGLIGSPVGDSAAPTVDDPDPTLPDRVETQLDEALVERVNTLNQTAVGQRAERLRDDSTDQEVQFQLREQLTEQELTELQSIRVRQVASELLDREGQTGAASLVPKINETYTGTLIRGGMDDQGQAVALNKSSYTLVENSPHLVNDTALVVDRGTLPDSRSDAVTLTVVFETSDGSTETTEYGLFHNTSAGQNVIELEESYTFGGGGDDNVSVQATTATLDLSAGELRGAGTARGTVTDINSYDGIKRIELSDGVYAPGVDDGAFVGLSMVVGAAPGSGTPASSHIGDLPDGVETQSVPLEASFDVLQATAEQSIATPMTLSAEYRAWDLGRTPFRLTGSTYDLRLGSDATYVPGDFHALNPTGPADAAPATQEFAFLPNDYNQSTYDYQVLRNDATGTTVDITGSVVAMRAYPFDQATTEFIESSDAFTLAPRTCATGATGTSGCVEIDTTSRTYEPLQNVTPGGYITLEANVSTATGYTTIREDMQVVEPYYIDAGPVQPASSIPRYGQGWSVDETHALEMQLYETADLPPTIYNVTTDPDTTFEIVDGKQFADISASGTALEPNTSAFTDRVAATVTVRATHDGWARDGYRHEFDLELVDPPAPITDVDLQFDVEALLAQRSDVGGAALYDAFTNVSGGSNLVTGPPLPVPTAGDTYDMASGVLLPVPIKLNVTFADGTSQLQSVNALESSGYDVTLDLENHGINHTLDRDAMAASALAARDDAPPLAFGQLTTIGGEPHYIPKQDTYTATPLDADTVGYLATADAADSSVDLFNETALAGPAFASGPATPEIMASADLLPADIIVNGTVELEETATGTTTSYEGAARRPAHPFTYEGIAGGSGEFRIKTNPTGTVPPDEKFSGNGTIVRAAVEYVIATPTGTNGTATVPVPGSQLPDALLASPYSATPNWAADGPLTVEMTGDGGWHGGSDAPTTGWKPISFPAFINESYAAGLFETPSSASIASDRVPALMNRWISDPPEPSSGSDDSASPSLLIIGNGDSTAISHQFGGCAMGPAPTCAPQVPGIGTMTVTEGKTLFLRVWDSGVLQNVPDRNLRDGIVSSRSESKCQDPDIGCTISRQTHADLTQTEQTANLDSWMAELKLESFGTGYSSGLPGAPRVADFTALEPATGDVTFTTDTGEETEIQVEVVPKDEGGI